MKKKGCKFFCFAVVDATLEVYVAEFMTCFHFFFPLPPPPKKKSKVTLSTSILRLPRQLPISQKHSEKNINGEEVGARARARAVCKVEKVKPFFSSSSSSSPLGRDSATKEEK